VAGRYPWTCDQQLEVLNIAVYPRAVRMRQSHPENQGLPVKNAEISTANAGFGPSRLSAASDDAWQASGYVCLMASKLMEEKEVEQQKRPRSFLKMWRGWSCALPCICMQELPAALEPRISAYTLG